MIGERRPGPGRCREASFGLRYASALRGRGRRRTVPSVFGPFGSGPLPRRKLGGAAPPPLAAALPLLAAALRAGLTQGGTWFWGDQALIDLEARNSLVGRNLLGVYDRYGWHHLGPLWLAL